MTTLAIVSSQAFSLVNFRGLLIQDLVRSGVTVLALAPDFDHSTLAAVELLGAKPVHYGLSRAGMNPLSDLIDTFRLARLLSGIKPDIVFGYFIKPVVYGSIAASLARVPKRFAMIEGLGYVFTPQQNGRESFSRVILRLIVTWLYRLALSRVDKVIFLNDEDISDFCSQKIVNRKKTFKLGGIGIDLNDWAPEPPVISPITFLLAARLLREKGIVEYVTAAREIKSRYPLTRFILLGGLDPNPGGLTKTEVQGWVDEGLVEWPGHVAVKPWLTQASVYVLPSYYREGVPRSTQEAMAMARPVITCDTPGCRDTVVSGENGFLVHPRDVDSLVEAMERFICRPELIESMGRASRRLAEERFDAHVANRKLMNLMGLNSTKNDLMISGRDMEH